MNSFQELQTAFKPFHTAFKSCKWLSNRLIQLSRVPNGLQELQTSFKPFHIAQELQTVFNCFKLFRTVLTSCTQLPTVFISFELFQTVVNRFQLFQSFKQFQTFAHSSQPFRTVSNRFEKYQAAPISFQQLHTVSNSCKPFQTVSNSFQQLQSVKNRFEQSQTFSNSLNNFERGVCGELCGRPHDEVLSSARAGRNTRSATPASGRRCSRWWRPGLLTFSTTVQPLHSLPKIRQPLRAQGC